jgi:hypothetical protein
MKKVSLLLGVFLILFMVGNRFAQAGEMQPKPGLCVKGVFGGGHPFPLSAPGRMPWTKLVGSWEDMLEGTEIIEIRPLALIGEDRPVRVAMWAASDGPLIASGDAYVPKNGREIDISMIGPKVRIHARFTVREIKDRQSVCAGQSVFVMDARVLHTDTKRVEHRSSILSRID